MHAYIVISRAKRSSFQKEVDAILEALKQYSITSLIFIDNYHFTPSQEKEMMEQAFAEIDKADLLIAEVSDKAIGIGVEAGYAKAKNKPVVYIRNEDAEHSTTVAGTSDYVIIYEDAEDLKNQLAAFLQKQTTDQS